MSALFWNLPESVTTLNSPQGNHRFPQNTVTIFEGAMPWLLVNSAFLVFAAAFPGSGRESPAPAPDSGPPGPAAGGRRWGRRRGSLLTVVPPRVSEQVNYERLQENSLLPTRALRGA